MKLAPQRVQEISEYSRQSYLGWRVEDLTEHFDFSIQIDFSSLSRQLKDLRTNDSVKKMHDNLNKELQSKQETLERIQAPNMKVNSFKACVSLQN